LIVVFPAAASVSDAIADSSSLAVHALKKLYENEKYEFQREKPRAQVGRKSSVLRPTCALQEGFGPSAQVGRKLRHEQNRLMRTKEHSAPGKTALIHHRVSDVWRTKSGRIQNKLQKTPSEKSGVVIFSTA
jgi:hypothetical protein